MDIDSVATPASGIFGWHRFSGINTAWAEGKGFGDLAAVVDGRVSPDVAPGALAYSSIGLKTS